MAWWLASIAMADAPAVAIEWTKEGATVSVDAPAGHKVAADAPGTLVLRTGTHALSISTTSGALDHGVAVGDRRGAALEGELEVALCLLDGSACRQTHWTLRGSVPDRKRGNALLSVTPPAARTHETRFGPASDTSAAEGAFERAAAAGRPVLLDFSAVWCPPCNVFAAEILDGDPDALAGLEWAVVDVDHPSSWPLKDRYAVGGYPTLIVADPDGTERARLVGYAGKAQFLDWLAASAARSDGADLARDPATVDPARAAELAWALAERGDGSLAGPWLERGSAATQSVELHLARATVEHDPEAARWVREHAPSRQASLLLALPGIAGKDPELARRIAEDVVRTERGRQLSHALSVAAEIEPDAERKRMLFGASAAVLAGELTGDPDHDRGFISDLAELEEAAGDRAGALRRLEAAREQYPNVPTFHFYAARMWLRGDDADKALAAAERAIALSWGDNRLRAAIVRSQALVALGRTEEAAARAHDALAEQPPPPADLSVRTTRFRTELEALARTE